MSEKMNERTCKICGSDENVSTMVGAEPSLMCGECHERISEWLKYHRKNLDFKMKLNGVYIPEYPEDPDDVELLMYRVRDSVAKSELNLKEARSEFEKLIEELEAEE